MGSLRTVEEELEIIRTSQEINEIKTSFGNITERYKQNIGDHNLAEAIREAFDTIIDRHPAFKDQKQYNNLREYVTDEYNKIQTLEDVPGVESIVKKLKQKAIVVDENGKLDDDELIRYVVKKVLKRDCGCEPNSFEHITKADERLALTNLEPFYQNLRIQLLPEYSKEQNIRIFNNAKQSIDKLIEDYEADRDMYYELINAYDKTRQLSEEKLPAEIGERKAEYERRAKEIIAANKITFPDTDDIKTKRKKEKNNVNIREKLKQEGIPEAIIYELKPQRRSPNAPDFNAQLSSVDSWISYLEENLTRKILEETVADITLLQEYDKYCSKLKRHKKDVEADKTIAVFLSKMEEGNKFMDEFKRADEKDKKELASQHIINLQSRILAFFEDSSEFENIKGADEIKGSERDLVRDFEDYHTKLKKHIYEVKTLYKGETIETLETPTCYDITCFVKDIKDRGICEKVDEYNHVAFHFFDPKKNYGSYYNTRLKQLRKIADFFAEKRKETKDDEALALNLEKCVETINAFMLRTQVIKCRQITAMENPEQAAKDIERLAEEAKSFSEDTFQHLYNQIRAAEITIKENTDKDMVPYHKAMEELGLTDNDMKMLLAQIKLNEIRTGETVRFRRTDIDHVKDQMVDSSAAMAELGCDEEDLKEYIQDGDLMIITRRSGQPIFKRDEIAELKGLEARLMQELIDLKNKPDRSKREVVSVLERYQKYFGMSQEEIDGLKKQHNIEV